MIKTARQLKDLIRNLSKKNAADAQILMRNSLVLPGQIYPQGRDAGGRDGRPGRPLHDGPGRNAHVP